MATLFSPRKITKTAIKSPRKCFCCVWLCVRIPRKTGAPQKLSELTPAILRAIPTDVYNDGKPFFYQNDGAKYRLWSVGPDGVNDGGVPLEQKPNDKGHKPAPNLYGKTLKGDFVAILCR